MDLSTKYMGFSLPHPLIPGASPLVDNMDTVRRLEDAGAPMIVMHSLFEEQIEGEAIGMNRAMESVQDTFAEALSYFPELPDFTLGPDEYLEQLRKIKEAVSIPVIGSLNGTTDGGWLVYARYLQQAGADGLELNIYDLATDLEEDGQSIEDRTLRIVKVVKEGISIPITVKLSPYYSSVANLVKKLDELGVDGVLLFNRLYQPDIDPEQLNVFRVNLSSPGELLLRLRWLAILSGRVNCSLGCTGGVHTAVDAIKAVMAGADGVQMVSALLRHGPNYLKHVLAELERWLVDHEYESLNQMRGSMNLQRCADPHAYERANYMKILQSWDSEQYS